MRESGKPLAEATREWQVAGDLVRVVRRGGQARRTGYTIPPRVARTAACSCCNEPIGVVGVITAWNFPAYNPARAVAAALAAGCTVVVRPAELTPLSAMAMAAILVEAGLPPGVIALVNGDPARDGPGDARSPGAAQDQLHRQRRASASCCMDGASRTMTRLSLELGGNAPVLILPDADIAAVARGAVAARFRNAGQVCVSPQRFFVEKASSRAFEEVVVEETRKLPVGSGLEPATRIGPLISGAPPRARRGLIAQRPEQARSVRTGGARPKRAGLLPRADRARQRHARDAARSPRRSSARCSR